MKASVQQIAKQLVNAGLKKSTTKRENFQTVCVGDYSASHLKIYGLNLICITPANGITCEKIQSILSNYQTEVRNGIVVVR